MSEALQSQTQPQDAPTTPNWEMGLSEWMAVIGAALGAFMAVLDIQITNASLREIQGALGLDLAEGGWISSAYLIAEVIIIPLSIFFSKVFGLRRFILTNVVLFIFSSILCGFSFNLESIIVFRVLQGLAGGALIPLSFQIILLYMPLQKRTLGLAIFGMTATLAPTLGPSLGGWLTENYGWRSIFWINLLPGFLMYLAIRHGLPTSKIQLFRMRKFDGWGTLFLILGLGTLTYILEEGARVEWFENDSIRISSLICLFSLPLFLMTQIFSPNPLLSLKLLKDKNFSFSVFITTIAAIALYGGVYSLSIYLGQIQNYSALHIGEVMMWIGIPQLVVMPMMPFLMNRLDSRLLVLIGLLFFAVSNYLNCGLNYDYSGEQFRYSLILRALGQPLFMIPLSAIGMAKILPSESGNAAAIYNVMRNIGGSIGIAISGTFLISRSGEKFNQLSEFLSLSNPAATERIIGIQRYFMLQGSDSVSAKEKAILVLKGLMTRESIIQSFGDVFYLFFIGLLICFFLVLFMSRAEKKAANLMDH